MALTDIKAKQAKAKGKTYKLSDEKGLYLEVTSKGYKYWRWKYRFADKEKRLSLGVYPEVSLKEAREKRDVARKLLATGVDPSQDKQERRVALLSAQENSFEIVACEWFAKEKTRWSERHAQKVLSSLERDLFPQIGNLAIADISAPALLRALRKVEQRGTVETVRRIWAYAGRIFRYAVATGRADRDVAADLKDALPKSRVKHFAAITESHEVGRLLLAIDSFEGTATVKAALQLSPLFFCRPGELRHLEWSDVNWENERIEIPAERMKMNNDHIIPLACQSVVILKQLHLLTRYGRYIFPSARGGVRPLSDNGIRTALRTMGYDNETMTPHGFRAMTRTLLDEVLEYPIHIIEQQLAHTVKDPTGRAYNRTKHLPQRREMMQSWADYLDTLRDQFANKNVVAIHGYNRKEREFVNG